ncbi:MAG: cytochrome c family protein [Alphaproteobacteria bacterium]|nr:MAG: cytochrome c family protein [Alphaproteobacteria bacterium]
MEGVPDMNKQKGNMIFAATLIALIIWLISAMISEALVDPVALKQSVYKIDVPDHEVGAQVPAQKEGPEPIDAFMEQADAIKGKSLMRQCMQCHSFDKGGPHKIGPNLWGVYGSSIGAKEGYAYSSGSKKLADKKWTDENLNHFLYKPRAFMPGTKMAYVGLKRAKDRANIIAYLKTLV